MNGVFFNRDVNWVEFNARVLQEGIRDDIPVLERVKFFAIFGSNFDEFFKVRVAALRRQWRRGDIKTCPSGMLPSEAVVAIENRARELYSLAYAELKSSLLPALEEKGISVVSPESVRSSLRASMESFFDERIFPILTPIGLDEDFPFINGELSYVYILFKDGKKALVRIPPSVDGVLCFFTEKKRSYHVFTEALVEFFCYKLFPGMEVEDSVVFRIVRDADLSVDEERDEDFIEAMEAVIEDREVSMPVALFIRGNNSSLVSDVISYVSLEEAAVFFAGCPVALSSLFSLYNVNRQDIKNEVWPALLPPEYDEELTIWDNIRRGDILFFHPYHSFLPVIRLVEDAAVDPCVLAIKMTLYRTSTNSPIVAALERAARNGKIVVAVVELKARFDEQRNIAWARRLERAGATVLYGIRNLKVHAKALMIIRNEDDGLRRYVHVSTGNYNENTAQFYSDIGIMTAREDLCTEMGLFFNMLTGYTAVNRLEKLAMAPVNLKERFIFLIDREIARKRDGENARIIAKLNSLVDRDIIESLYRASCEGVEIFLCVRGVCMLVPGVSGLSENISVISIVDRFLEHSRIFYFENGGEPEVFIASSDWMPRNLERRVELLVPVERSFAKKRIIDVLSFYFSDTSHAYCLDDSGSYERVEGVSNRRAQQLMYEYFRMVSDKGGRAGISDGVFNVRRSPSSS
ncbi:polyphosphate kinase 1 [Spirochaetia bacterium 38H-sp]|uniref:Polyphosphate kinase n=1 Tax=Rarispira pelagica TaxID=3141764 RepID=A0ABU9U8Z5_9SPIR